MRVETLVIVHRDDKVLLGLKKEREGRNGFGVGKWNGFGGGLEDGDDGDLEVCVCREALEEGGIHVKNLVKIGETLYKFVGDEQDHLVHIYVTEEFDGEPMESDEMRPEWFGVADIPYDKMWKNDKFWMPYLLERKEFKAEICMTADGETTSCVINGEEHLENGN